MRNLKNKITASKVVAVVSVIGLCGLIWAGIDAYQNRTMAEAPMEMPGAIKITYDENGNLQAEDIGDTFTWEGYWQADDNVIIPDSTANPAASAIYIDDNKTTLDADAMADIQAVQQELSDVAAIQQAADEAEAEEEARQAAKAATEATTNPTTSEPTPFPTLAPEDEWVLDYTEDMNVEATPDPNFVDPYAGDPNVITGTFDFGDESQHVNPGLEGYSPSINMSDWDITIY